jgi:tetratricopeptide (TPR) repeat protein
MLLYAGDWLWEVRTAGAEMEAAHRWEEAARLYESALGQERSQDTRVRMWLLSSLAEVEFERKAYARSERWLTEAERVAERLPANAPERVRLLNAWGTLHLVRGNLTAAERDLSRAAALAEGEDRAAALHNLAAAEMHMGRLPDAAAHETEALEIWRERLGERHSYVMKAWVGLSSAQALQGNWVGAERSLRQALASGESEEALANYAVVLEQLKRGKEARAIRSRLKQSGFVAPAVVDMKSLERNRAHSVRTR